MRYGISPTFFVYLSKINLCNASFAKENLSNSTFINIKSRYENEICIAFKASLNALILLNISFLAIREITHVLRDITHKITGYHPHGNGISPTTSTGYHPRFLKNNRLLSKRYELLSTAKSGALTYLSL